MGLVAAALSINDALLILLEGELYGLCAKYIGKPEYGTTSAITITHIIRTTKTITPSTTTTVTISKGTAYQTEISTEVDSVSSAFATATDYSFDFVTKTRRTRVTLPVTTIYTTTTRANAKRALSTFPPPLQLFTKVLSSACSTLLASHTSYTTTTALPTTTLTQTAPTSTIVAKTTVPRTTVIQLVTLTTTSILPYISFTTTTTTFTGTTTITRTFYASTTHVPAQCAPTAYVINADLYNIDDGAFVRASDQPDALSCCQLCISTSNCQAWVWYGDPLGFYGACVLVTGVSEDSCPATDYHKDVYPSCRGLDENMFSFGLGACSS